VYALDVAGLDAVEAELARLRSPLASGMAQRLDALHTEVARGRRAEKSPATISHATNEEAS